MTSEKPDAAAAEPIATAPSPTDFCADDADVIIRTVDSFDFHVHKLILSLVSPVFRDMFTLPHPPSATSNSLPIVDIQESAKTWENLLRTIYPTFPDPTIDRLDDLESLLIAAQAYEMQSVIDAHIKLFENRNFIQEDPLHLFTIACACELEDQAGYVARNAELLKVTRRFGSGDLKGLTLVAYGRFVAFLIERDNEWRRTVATVAIPRSRQGCSRGCITSDPLDSREKLYRNIKENLEIPGIGAEEVYLKALESRSYSGCLQEYCPFSTSKIKGFIKVMIEGREEVCDKFKPVKWFT